MATETQLSAAARIILRELVDAEVRRLGRGVAARLAKHADISPSMLAHIRKGRRNVGYSVARRIAHHLGLDADALIAGTVARRVPKPTESEVRGAGPLAALRVATEWHGAGHWPHVIVSAAEALIQSTMIRDCSPQEMAAMLDSLAEMCASCGGRLVGASSARN